MSVLAGRRTHDATAAGQLTVFLIGMRFNKLHRVDAWFPVVRAMPGMLAELARDPDSGFLGCRMLVGGKGVTVVQYWRTPEQVYEYASDPGARHRPAWSAFNRKARKAVAAVGIWHETYQVARAETVYVDTPPTGLGAAVGTTEVASDRDRARQRIAAAVG